MARQSKTIVTIVDDLDGTTIEESEAETVRFSIDGGTYEIDLSKANAKALRDALKPYVKAARGVSNRGRSSGGSRKSKEDLAAAREWLRANGHEVSDRGRIPAALLDEYRSNK